MNIIKLQNELKSVPDQALIGYVQNPTGQVPSYLALSELQRRKEMREKYQQTQAPESSVAEDLTQSNQGGLATLAKNPTPQGAPIEPGVAGLPTGDMYQEQNFATGGIVAFAQGGIPPDLNKPDDLGVIMPYVPTWDDLKMEQMNAYEQYGVDPEFYAKQAKKLKQEQEDLKAEKSQAGWMGLARAGLGMAAGTSPFALKNISEGAIQGVTQYAADVKDIKAQDRLLKQADMKLAEAQNAQARGDAQAAIKAMDERKNLLLNAQLKEADIRKDINVADAKIRATLAGKEGDLNSKIYDKYIKDFTASFPSGSASGVFKDNPGFLQFVKNVYLKNAQDYIKSGTMPAVPSESQLLDMFKKGNKSAASAKPASSLSGENSPLAATRPKNIQNILDKYPTRGSRSTNTQEELDVPWDLAGQGLED